MANVEWAEAAIKDLEKLDERNRHRIIRKIAWFSGNFEKCVPERLEGKFRGSYKLRIGDWRAIYTIEENVVIIRFIGHRSDIYK